MIVTNKEYKIVKILDEYTLIINAGTDHDVKSGDKFQILDKKGSRVIDPDTNEVLGQLDLVKATVEVSDLQEKMCICSSQFSVKVNSPFSGQVISSGLKSITDSLSIAEQERLNVDLSQVSGGKRRSNAKIRLGDVARLIKSTK